MMKSFKKVLFGGVALSAFSFAVVSPVFAAEETLGDANKKDATSYGHVTLEADDETETTDPIIPGEDGGETGNTGSLRIDWVTPLEFGTQKLSSKAMTYKTESTNPNVQVSDFRGTGEGWKLQVTASAFTDEDGHVLKGSVISLPVGEVEAAEDNLYKEEAPTVSNEVTELFTDGTDQTHTILTASKDTGMGTWADKFNAGDVELYVPAGNYAGDYTAELTWTLVDAE